MDSTPKSLNNIIFLDIFLKFNSNHEFILWGGGFGLEFILKPIIKVKLHKIKVYLCIYLNF